MINWQILIEVTVLMFLFYGAYMLSRKRMTHIGRRFTLLLIPLIAVFAVLSKSFFAADLTVVNLPVVEMDPVSIHADLTSQSTGFFSWKGLYILGAVLMLGFLIVRITRLLYFFRRAVPYISNTKIKILITDDKEPFSFFNRIHLSAQMSQEEKQVVLDHEILHCEKSHSLDLILMEIYHSLFWFNPLMILIKRELVQVHEHEVDEVMYDKYDKTYLHHLLSYSLGASVAHLLLTSQFYQKMTLAKRIKEMKNKRRTNRLSIMAIPFVALCFILTSWTYSTEKTPLVSGYAPIENNDGEGDIDEKPQFKGGQEALIKYMSENVNYPDEAKKKNLEGTVFISFKVNTSGELSDVKVSKGVHKSLDAEAKRVVENMPNWEPGKKDGKPVNTEMTLPIAFKL